ncbi:hypothetical protein [Marivirga lumbricoides]
MKHILLAISLSIISFNSFSQTRDLNVSMYNFANLWQTDSIIDLYSGLKVKKMEPIGFFGDKYQRFYVHFISVIKNQQNPNEYLVYGKNKLKDNISEIMGSLKISKASIYDFKEIDSIEQGILKGTYILFEDNSKAGTGKFYGKFETEFMIINDNIYYSSIYLSADGFLNNQFQGVWSSYSSGKNYTCNWGDYRIPDSGDLDNGAGEFSVNEKYYANGWRSFETSKGYGMNATREEIEKARDEENKEWWE